MSWQRKVNEAKASAAALKTSMDGLSSERKPPESKWRTFFRRSRLEEVQVVKNNTYDRGLLHNIREVIFPFSSRPSFSRSKSKSGWDCCNLYALWRTVLSFHSTLRSMGRWVMLILLQLWRLMGQLVSHGGGWPSGDCTISYAHAFAFIHGFVCDGELYWSPNVDFYEYFVKF